jgi:hypothetical protein
MHSAGISGRSGENLATSPRSTYIDSLYIVTLGDVKKIVGTWSPLDFRWRKSDF